MRPAKDFLQEESGLRLVEQPGAVREPPLIGGNIGDDQLGAIAGQGCGSVKRATR
jgi:hypothetical protein